VAFGVCLTFARCHGTEEETRLVGHVSYLYIICACFCLCLALMTAYKNLSKPLDAWVPLFVASTGISIKMSLFKLLLIICGKFGFPEMGAEGAAAACLYP